VRLEQEMNTLHRDPQGVSLRVAVYSRVSTSDQDNENQLAQLRQYCEKQGYLITTEYVDVASGGKSDRQQFKQMFLDASQRRFDLLLFWSLDRLSREGVLSTLQYLQRLTEYGIAYRSFTEQYLDSLGPFRDAVLAILACIARQERIRLSERTKAGLAKAKAQGKQSGRPKALKPYQIEKASLLRKQKLSWPAIATKFACHPDTVRRAVIGGS
jgi:DNA invertase Pin-like site-specific DNA recombinase